MIILGIDPALVKVGWGIIKILENQVEYVNSGVLKTSSGDNLAHRLGELVDNIDLIITKYSPDFIAMEEVFINKNFKSSMMLSHARGAILASIGRSNIPFSEYAPNRIKKSTVGAGKARKNQMQAMVKILMNITHELMEDEADALAVAYTASVFNYNRF